MPDRYYLWGAGSVGRRALKYLQPLGILEAIIDSDRAKQGQTLYGLTIAGYEAFMPSLRKAGVIVAHFEPEETEEILAREGIPHWRLSEFVTMWYWAQRRQFAIGFLDFPVTARCSLNCRDCMQYIPHRPKHDVPLDVLKRDLKALFSLVSFVAEISIIGGEPFLYEQLPYIIEYIKDNYRERVGSLVITTNGTVTPDSRTLEQCRDAGVFISVSDYSGTLPWVKENIGNLESAARTALVSIERKRWSWTAPGRFDASDGQAVCGQTHMQLSDGKLWRCTLMAAGHAAGFCAADNGDYFDLLQNNSDTLQKFLNDVELTGRTSQCRKCLYRAKITIPSAVQN